MQQKLGTVIQSPDKLFDISAANLPGDGIGREVAAEAIALLEQAGRLSGRPIFNFQHFLHLGARYMEDTGQSWTPAERDFIVNEAQAFFMIALEPVRKEAGFPEAKRFQHMEEIILQGGRVGKATNINMRPVVEPHPDFRLTHTPQTGGFRLFLTKGDSSEELLPAGFESSADGKTCVVTECHRREDYRSAIRNGIAATQEESLGQPAAGTLLGGVSKWNVLKHAHRMAMVGAFEDLAEEISNAVGAGCNPRLLTDSFCELLVRAPEKAPRILVSDATHGALLSPMLEALNAGAREPLTKQVNLVIVRENIEGMYRQIGEVIEEVGGQPQAVTQKGIFTERMIREVVDAGIEIAIDRKNRGLDQGVRAITVVLPESWPVAAELWKEIALKVGEEKYYPVKFMNGSEFLLRCVTDPDSIAQGVYVASNMLGDIIGDAAAGLVGGLGVPATHNFNYARHGFRHTGMTTSEPLGGTAPDIAGKGIANPIAALLTAGAMLRYYGHPELEDNLLRAIHDVTERSPELRTPDIGGPSRDTATKEFGSAIRKRFAEITNGR